MPNGYSVGNLELDITALDKSATSLDTLVNRLRLILNTVSPVTQGIKHLRANLSAISRLQFGSLDRLASGLNRIASINTQGLYGKINSVTRTLAPLKELTANIGSLSAINSFANGIQKITKLDVAGFDTQIKALTASLRPFLQEITLATPALTAFATAMNAVKGRRTINFKQFNQTPAVNGNIAKTLNLAGILGKVYFIRNYTKQLGQFMAGLVQSAIDYTETLNLWQVAMRGNIDTAEEFISKMNKAYGIAEETLMRYQATFRNMLSTLGGVSADVSYGLSEYLTQMALDYASLYNTSIEKAMTVFQSVLSGQVRPIRSISGYDITETTIFELYKQLGGTKTMRQLTQTEKRLLRIYAVFQQMDRSGAIGDLNKTLNNTANQMRIMSESTKELGLWVGKLVELYIAPAIPYINAFLITAKNVAQAIVKTHPEYSEFDGTIKGYEDTAEAIEQVQGKLLDFDKFRSLSSNENDGLGSGIDKKLVEGLTQYQSILINVTNKATELAEKWTKWWVSDDGGLTEQAKNLLAIVEALAIELGVLAGYALIKKVGELTGKILGLTTAMSLLNGTLGVGIIASFIRAIELFKEGNIWGGILATTIGVVLVRAFMVANQQALITFWKTLKLKVVTALQSVVFALGGVKQAVISLTANIALMGVSFGLSLAILSFFPKEGQKIAGAIMTIAGAFIALATAIAVYKQTITLGTALPILAVSIGAALAGGMAWKGKLKDISQFKNGGLPEKGTVFVAGEAGAEMVYNTPSGQSGVANISQIAQADYSGTRQALNDWWASARNDIPAFREANGTGIYELVDGEARRRGKRFANR